MPSCFVVIVMKSCLLYSLVSTVDTTTAVVESLVIVMEISPAFPLESLYTWRSLRQCWARLVARLFYPRCREEVEAELNRRAGLEGRVVSRCRCGGLEVECQGHPGLVTVCHCSVCRYDEAVSLGLEDGPAPSFCAVPRSRCRLVVRQPNTENIFTFRNSSEFARRGRCKVAFTTQASPGIFLVSAMLHSPGDGL